MGEERQDQVARRMSSVTLFGATLVPAMPEIARLQGQPPVSHL